MPTTISPSQVNGDLMTWDSLTASWEDQFAGLRTWGEAYEVIDYSLLVGEAVTLAEALSNGVSIEKPDSFGIAEARRATVGKNSNESMTFLEDRAVTVGQKLVEALHIAEAPSKVVSKPFAEAFSIAESRKSTVGLNPAESLGVSESFGRVAKFVRGFSETFAIAEVYGKSIGLNVHEALRLIDAWRRQADLVISDMLIATGDLTLEDFADFMAYGSMPGYEKWRDFIPGDYNYREAMFRVVLESKNADRGLLTDLQVAVDVPDLIDRGSATITSASAGAYVDFNRTFHIVPEITLSARGGAGENPIAAELNGAPTKEGFSVRLRDTITGAFVTGSFTWAAHGY